MWKQNECRKRHRIFYKKRQYDVNRVCVHTENYLLIDTLLSFISPQFWKLLSRRFKHLCINFFSTSVHNMYSTVHYLDDLDHQSLEKVTKIRDLVAMFDRKLRFDHFHTEKILQNGSYCIELFETESIFNRNVLNGKLIIKTNNHE